MPFLNIQNTVLFYRFHYSLDLGFVVAVSGRWAVIGVNGSRVRPSLRKSRLAWGLVVGHQSR